MKSRTPTTAPKSFEFQTLERRCLMSVGTPTVAAPAAASSSHVAKPAKLAAVPSTADRQELLANWRGSNAAQLSSLLAAGNTAGFDQALLDYMVSRSNAHYFFAPGDVPAAVSFNWSHIPQQVNNTVALADKIMAGIFPDQTNSSGYTVQLPHDFSWTQQPSTTKNPAFLHSLNTMSFWTNLALAYRQTGNVAYGNELIRQMTSWTRANPPLANPNDWPNTSPRWWRLDAAARVDNWIFSYYLLLGTAALTPSANTMFLHDMLEHAQFLHNVTAGATTSNQTITHASALLELGLIFPEFKYAKYYRSHGQDLLFKSANAQLYADGGQAEESPGYQGVVLDGLLDPYQLSVLNGYAWPQAQIDRLRNSADSYYQLLNPDATLPALSDTYRSSGAMLIGRAALVLNESGWALTRTRVRDVFVLGQSKAAAALSATTTPTLTARGNDFAMPVSGYWMTRTNDVDRNARQLVMDAGPTGGFHGHYDLLNFELYGYGKPLIADPGAYQYDDSKNRTYVLSTAAHNTINVDGVNHEREDGAGNKAIILDQWTTAGDHVVWSAHHLAYTGLKGSPVVGRTIWSNRDDLTVVVDFANAGATHTFTSAFNLAGSNVSALVNGEIHTTNSSGNVMVKTVMGKGIATSAKKSFISNNPPPNHMSAATHYTAGYTGTGGVLANIVIAYAGSTPPTVSASWVTVPKRGRDGVIKVTRNGVDQFITIPSPSLSTKVASRARRATAKPQALELAVVPPVTVSKGIFSAATKKDADIWD